MFALVSMLVFRLFFQLPHLPQPFPYLNAVRFNVVAKAYLFPQRFDPIVQLLYALGIGIIIVIPLALQRQFTKLRANRVSPLMQFGQGSPAVWADCPSCPARASQSL